MSVDWKPYVQGVGLANDDDVKRVETALGIRFPDEFRLALKAQQGCMPEPNIIQSDALNPVFFGPLLHVESDSERSSFAILKYHAKWSGVFPNLIPIADSAGTGCFFAYDFGSDPKNPRIVFVNTEADPDEELDEAVLFVARDFTELTANLNDQRDVVA